MYLKVCYVGNEQHIQENDYGKSLLKKLTLRRLSHITRIYTTYVLTFLYAITFYLKHMLWVMEGGIRLTFGNFFFSKLLKTCQ